MRNDTRRHRFAVAAGECFDGFIIAVIVLGIAVLLHGM